MSGILQYYALKQSMSSQAATDCSTANFDDGSWISIPLESSSSAMALAASGTSPASLSFEAVLPRFKAATDETNTNTHWMCDDLANDGPCAFDQATKTLKVLLSVLPN